MTLACIGVRKRSTNMSNAECSRWVSEFACANGEDLPAGTRLASGGGMADRLLTDANWKTLGALETFASECGRSLLELAVGWLASQRHVASVISGATKPEQVTANAKAGEWKLTAEERARVNELTAR